jgi:hypothetical protein
MILQQLLEPYLIETKTLVCALHAAYHRHLACTARCVTARSRRLSRYGVGVGNDLVDFDPGKTGGISWLSCQTSEHSDANWSCVLRKGHSTCWGGDIGRLSRGSWRSGGNCWGRLGSLSTVGQSWRGATWPLKSGNTSSFDCLWGSGGVEVIFGKVVLLCERIKWKWGSCGI